MCSRVNGYTIIDLLGTGTYGKVYRALRSDKQEVVLKSVSLVGCSAQEETEILNEVWTLRPILIRQSRVMSRLDHPNILKFYESFVDNRTLYLVMEYAQGGDLSKKIRKQKS